ncbi:hypothetical protein Gbro_0545 [Gordonia bronchialis DSM 43247]|uniref:Uncharacterized protein n=1 Tax=Gordonia bronchialis (strain ATCC 25592 / DSM 43247 / BCRC 13721 / JCM 3198 / KCTC 3076 / NBRC 16047 / NCTC 10667) TaxID=526226 RepID=D0LEF7_GORB4|nr:hypothetical protein [Gordonia bronchialis]ACY19875.1 hypothetical protein Gbro_0545 [Gordonia bronchialis DSM 43247]MCC3322647.1 hypothetical protein [Gordonia bronchialis]QGS26257.1 hypothetical protein FOB84_21110 [Gordonia bronchialis]STQ62652.1 Uncharacterised protein [Gordonia bronchialis]
MNRFRKPATALAAAGAIVAGTLAGTVVGAGDAAARVDAGNYIWTTTKTLTGARGAYPVTIRGNVLTVDLPGTVIGAPRHARLHPTRAGAWMDYGGNRYTFGRKGNRYVGQELWLTINGAVVGTTTLTPRR